MDLGGSRLRVGLVSEGGQVADRIDVPTEAHRGPAAVLASVKSLIGRLLDATDRSRVTGIGIAAAGQIHPDTQAVVYAPNLGWNDVPLRDEIVAAFGLPTHVENDVRAAAWGEYRFGVGRGAQSLVAVFVGTGVGSGAVIEGRLVSGHRNVAGEIGHTQVVLDGLDCPCGQRGCLEVYASGSGFARQLDEALARGVPTTLGEATRGAGARLTAAMVRSHAEAGDALAGEMWARAEALLGLALANYVTLLNPEVLVLGGGVVTAVPALAERLAAAVGSRATILARAVRVVPAALGDAAGLVGAADRARSRP